MKRAFRCTACGYTAPNWFGQCSKCGEWGTAEEIDVPKNENKQAPKKTSSTSRTPVRLKSIETTGESRILTGISELDRVMGGGLVADGVSILAAPPGVGKSTLLLELSGRLDAMGKKVLYASGEESESQIKSRAERILGAQSNFYVLATDLFDDVLAALDEVKPDFVVVDSIQTFRLAEYTSRPGTPVQTMECASRMVARAKDKTHPFHVFFVGHMTKDGKMAGFRTLEHLVDTVVFLEEGEDATSLRLLLSTKNRFGPTGEIGLFEMREEGLVEITEPDDYFVTKRNGNVPGSALAMIKEGSRYLVVEVESLVSRSFTPYPQRLGDSLRRDELNTLISILEERVGVRLYDKNVILKTTGGIRLSEPSVNLAVIMAIASSVKNVAIPTGDVFIAEVGLTGELKRVPSIEYRVRELDRLGYKRVFVPRGTKIKTDSVEVVPTSHVRDVIREVLGERHGS